MSGGRRQGEVQVPWTDEELGFLQDRADWSAPRVADELGRTTRAVRCMRAKLRRGWSSGEPFWTLGEDQIILDSSHLPAKRIAEMLPGRSINSVQKRRKYLGVDIPMSAWLNPNNIGARPLLAKTCTRCSKLLQAEWFGFRPKRREWTSECRVCLSARAVSGGRPNPETAKKSRERLQAITTERASRRRQSWTEKDHQILSDPDLTILQKALRLHRTYSGTATACQRNGYKSHVGLGEPTDLWVIFNPNESVAEIATAA